MKFSSIILFLLIINGICNAEETKDHKTKDSTKLKLYSIPELEIMTPKQATQVRLMPSSISVMESKLLEDNNVTSLNDISAMAPNFFMPDYGSKLTSPVYIRGIGSRINSPSVGLNVDHVPFFEKAAFDFDMFDVERIEVLRGPQGTLYGRNTMGGLVNVYTKSPTKYQGTQFLVNTGNYDFYNGNINHYNKLSDNFGYSINLNYISEGGYFRNEFNNEQVDPSESIGSRVRLVWDLNEKNTLENITNFERSEEGGYPYALYDDETNTRSAINYNEFSFYDRDMLSNAFVYKYKGERYELHATSAYQYLSDRQGIDQDLSAQSIYYVNQDQSQDMFSQEVVVKSNYKENYNWLCGGYAFYQGFNREVNVDVYGPGMLVTKNYDHRIFGGAVFHESTMSDFFIDNLAFTFGIRADIERDQLDYVESNVMGGQFNQISDTVFPGLNSFQVLPKIAFKYEFNDYSNAYATISRGYKTGGYNSVVERPEDLTYNPEYSWNYEIGYKGTFFEDRLKADFAVFYIDWLNQQIYQPVPSGRGSMLKNAGHSTSKGVEISLNSTPIKDFDVITSFGYTYAQFESHVVDEETNYNGNFLPNVPLYTFSVTGSKLFRFLTGFVEGINVNAGYNMIGRIFWNEENNAYQNNYGLLNASITFKTEMFDLNVWSRNLLNEDYNAFYFQALGNSFVQRGIPATFGVQISTKI